MTSADQQAEVAPATAPRMRPRRHGPADPVRELMHRHHELCAGAVDPLEIAAGLEAHGVTDRVAGRFRHRDVFSLAEELYARVPRAEDRSEDRVVDGSGGRAPAAAGTRLPLSVIAAHLLPGAGCAAAALTVRTPAAAAAAAVLIALALWAVLRRGPLRAASGSGMLWACWLTAFALYGPQTVTALLGGPLAPPASATCTALALSLAPAAWLAHRFAARARAQLSPSRSLGEFAARVRPSLSGTLAAYTVLLLALVWAAASFLREFVPWSGPGDTGDTGADVAGTTALGLLLFTARLLALHGYAGVAAAGTAAACAVEAAASAAASLHRLPGAARFAAPAEAIGPARIPVLACGPAALALAVLAFVALSRASSHHLQENR